MHALRNRRKPSEEGYLLLAVMFLMAILVLSLAVAAPSVARSIQRDRDVETMERGKQYIRAIQLYYRKFHAYPPNADALVKTNEIRFLRKRYIDPITGKDDWTPILFGQNKTPTAMGFFGQPLSTGGSIAGIGPSGGNGLNGANGAGTSGGLFNSSGGSGFGSSFGGGSSIFSSPTSSTTNTAAPPSGSTDGTSASTNGAAPTSGSTDSSGNSASATGGTGGGPTGQTFGGAGIIGFSPASSKQSILIYKKKDHYNEWEFTYDPLMDMKVMAGGNTGTIGQPASNMSSPVGIPGITTPGTPTTPGNGLNSGSISTPSLPPDTSAPPQ